MRKHYVMVCVLSLALLGGGFALAKGASDTTVGADATVWDSAVALNPLLGIYPVGGAGQLNGHFTIVERDGIQIGLRATDRTDGLLTPTGKKTGRYEAKTGYDTGTTNRAEWNYDIHVDLRGTGTTLADYELTLTQTFASELFGSKGPLDVASFVPGNAVLFQTSQNPVFGNDTFDVDKKATYNLKLTLKPKKKGSPLVADIQVKVRDE